MLAVAGGVFFGLQDALTRVSGRVLTESGTQAMLQSRQTYGIVVAAVAGLTLAQNAFHAGPLWKSLPLMTVAEAVAGIACGIGYLGDRVQFTPTALAVESAGLVAVAVGLLLIGRHPAMPAGARVGGGRR